MWPIFLLATAFFAPSLARAAGVTTVFNNGAPYQFDTNGNAIDLTSGKVDFLNGAYIWYGVPFGCPDTCDANGNCVYQFCGITSYSSPDMATWSYNGFILDPNDASLQSLCAAPLSGNCGRPHIVYSVSTQKYVLWVNAGAPGYVTFTSNTPTSGYVQSASRALVGLQPPATQAGDFTVEVLNGVGYVVYSLIDFTTVGASIWPPFLQSMYLQPLTADLLQTTGNVTHVISAAGDLVDYEAESPDLFYRAPYYYISASNTCGFCTGTLLIMYRSKSLNGPWIRQIVSADTCGGQSTQVLTLPSPSGGSATYVHQADLFQTAPLTGTRMAAHGHQFQPLTFATDGSVNALSCALTRTFSVNLNKGVAPTTGLAVSSTDNSGHSASYNIVCDMPFYQLYQTWTSSKTGSLSEVGINIAGDNPNGKLSITIFRYQAEINFYTPRYQWTTLAQVDVPPSGISQALQVIRVPVNANVAKGDKLGIALINVGITPMCTGRATAGAGNGTLYAFGINQVSYRGPTGQTPPTQVLAGQTIKWYSTVV